jgi:hypothetical protein
MHKTPALIVEFLKSVQKVAVHSESGVHLGHAPIFRFDRPRVQAVMDKIVRGLFFKHTNRRLAIDYVVQDFLYRPEIEKPLQDDIAKLPLVVSVTPSTY